MKKDDGASLGSDGLVKPDQQAMQLALDLWVRRLQRIVQIEAQKALNGHEPAPVSVIAPTQADAAHIAEIVARVRKEGFDSGVSEAWSVAEYYTRYGVLPQRSKERKVADAITDGIRALHKAADGNQATTQSSGVHRGSAAP